MYALSVVIRLIADYPLVSGGLHIMWSLGGIQRMVFRMCGSLPSELLFYYILRIEIYVFYNPGTVRSVMSGWG